jgi:hypothetical protein
MTETVYFSKEFLNNLRLQCGMEPDPRTQEDMDRDTRIAVADAQVEQASCLLRAAGLNYDQAVKRAQAAWKS